MNYCIPTEVTEIKMVYQNRIKAAERPQIRSSQDAYNILAHHWSDQIGLMEEFYILLLDRSNRVMGRYLVSQGGVAGTVVDAKIVFACALKCRASSIILSHNHPSGNLTPSQADRKLTDKLRTLPPAQHKASKRLPTGYPHSEPPCALHPHFRQRARENARVFPLFNLSKRKNFYHGKYISHGFAIV